MRFGAFFRDIVRPVETKKLQNGFEMPVLGLGCWPLGGYRSADPRRDTHDLATLKHALSSDITHFDTAELYARGHSEELLGQAIAGYDRSKLFLASKASRESLISKEALKNACKNSLKRVGTDYFDLYYVHWHIPDYSLEDQMKAMEELYEEGLIKNIAVSNFKVETFKRAQEFCKYPIVANQVHYNLILRGPEADGLVEFCQENDVMLVAYRPVELGKLANTGNPVMLSLSEKYPGKKHAQIAINWLISQPNVVTIFGCLDKRFIDENLGALGWMMDSEDIEYARENYGPQIEVSDSVPLG